MRSHEDTFFDAFDTSHGRTVGRRLCQHWHIENKLHWSLDVIQNPASPSWSESCVIPHQRKSAEIPNVKMSPNYLSAQ